MGGISRFARNKGIFYHKGHKGIHARRVLWTKNAEKYSHKRGERCSVASAARKKDVFISRKARKGNTRKGAKKYSHKPYG